MRNIAEYPITQDEVVNVLKRYLPLEFDPQKHGIGNLDPMIGARINAFINRPEIMDQLIDSMKIK